ncbi:PhzF family phenazine biosynthesis protein [Flagellimonas meridianipacifica]|uniref:PhzF family phenazine biosynthesis protein n=1 Tax=Flagellimonas meridianipacifica TaxID=1080225 RepID=A0A2T0MHK2_9FLAO|nr:PhzF family phenazine biosynthesis protein [Allomuricauda pacifica]PRX57059.1 PhzF family phenazine biosynthesis protein [Allomuricauda pacifica]
MKQKIYQIDAFASDLFKGNPAAVCVMDEWLPDDIMQSIAEENNLAETAFTVLENGSYTLRWFTPETEVDLCGHATLATAYVLFNYYDHQENTIRFYSPRSGELIVTNAGSGLISLDFPTDEIAKIESVSAINQAIGQSPLETFKGKTDYMLVYGSQKEIESLNPNYFLLDQIDCRGVIATAPGDEVDFVSRFFAPKCGIPEDPVTGSAHTTMTPYWSKKLGKEILSAKQLSHRGGDLKCEDLGNRVKISGRAVPYLVGEIEL